MICTKCFPKQILDEKRQDNTQIYVSTNASLPLMENHRNHPKILVGFKQTKDFSHFSLPLHYRILSAVPFEVLRICSKYGCKEIVRVSVQLVHEKQRSEGIKRIQDASYTSSSEAFLRSFQFEIISSPLTFVQLDGVFKIITMWIFQKKNKIWLFTDPAQVQRSFRGSLQIETPSCSSNKVLGVFSMFYME